MYRTREPIAFFSAAVALALATAAVPGRAQEAAQEGLQRIVSSEISIYRDEARLDLEFANGRHSQFAIRGGRAFANGEALDAAPRGGDLDRSWRDLLNAAMETSGENLARLLFDWEAPGGAALDRQLEVALQGTSGRVPADAVAPDVPLPAVVPIDPGQLSDSVERLVDRIVELQGKVVELETGDAYPVRVDIVNRRATRGSWWERGPFGDVFRGLSGIVKVAILYGILFAIAFATIFFGGRRFIEGVADTARTATMRSLLVGLAASFLVIPAFILGIIALAISIVGIPVLLAWVPLFPVAVGLAVLLGYIGVAHAAGEALAERRFYATDWFQRGNSYYFLITGLGLLLAPFAIMHAVRMAGPWLGFVSGIAGAIGVTATWAALSIGLGAVLLSRAGTRGPGRAEASPEPEIYAETTGA